MAAAAWRMVRLLAPWVEGLRRHESWWVLVAVSSSKVTPPPNRVTYSSDRVTYGPNRVTYSSDRVTYSPNR
eukprot:84740-Chlamydomonas_euryale.AAC.1